MNSATRRRVLGAAAAVAVVGGVALFNRFVVRSGPPADALLVASASFAMALVATIGAEWPKSRVRLTGATSAAAALSLIATIAHRPREAPQDAFWILTEVVALLTLLVLVARWVSVRSAVIAGGLASAAVMATMWRITAPSETRDLPDVLGALLNWSFGVVLAAGLGSYLRVLDARRARSVVEARHAQRLEIARDLHDFVAHDVTGMVVQAQAAHVVASRSPHEALAALGRIEEAGLRALGSLDHTVRMLGDLAAPMKEGDPPEGERSSTAFASRRFALEDVLALVGRFAATDLRPVRLHVDTGPEPRLPSEVVSVAYRVILEALTNIRRHAPASARVDVSIVPAGHARDAAITVRVSNDVELTGDPVPSAPLRGDASVGGRGLSQLAECVADIGGSFSAGPIDGDGSRCWQVTALLPLGGGTRE